jgi:NADH:ubiquinone oxidoreductase subunit 3 (subunit A)
MLFILPWVLIPLIIRALVILNFVLIIKKSSQKKASIYECGFSPKFSARLPFSLRFFLLALLFLIFDVELVLVILFPIIESSVSRVISITVFCSFLFLGLLHEWNEGRLSWVK